MMMIKYISFTENEIKTIEDFRKRNSISSFSTAVRMILMERMGDNKLDEIVSSIRETNTLIKTLKNHIAPFAPME